MKVVQRFDLQHAGSYGPPHCRPGKASPERGKDALEIVATDRLNLPASQRFSHAPVLPAAKVGYDKNAKGGLGVAGSLVQCTSDTKFRT